jgi:cobalt/nickel transport protein
MKRITRLLQSATVLTALFVTYAPAAQAHFQMIIPSDDMVTQTEPRQLDIKLLFWHPMEGHGMNMVKPAQFGVLAQGQKQDLLATLKAKKIKDREGHLRDTFETTYKLKRPGDHIFYVEPKPYWEPAEESFIVHYTKVIVNAFGLEEGWDQEVGLKTEIVPLTRPYGLWTDNLFQGIVKVNGKPAPFTEVEVEYYDQGPEIKVPASPMITQVVKADANGVFTYAMPRAGWWGFAALNEDDKPMKHDGKDYPVEIGAVLWVKTHDIK